MAPDIGMSAGANNVSEPEFEQAYKGSPSLSITTTDFLKVLLFPRTRIHPRELFSFH